jgi:hypothetical protein
VPIVPTVIPVPTPDIPLLGTAKPPPLPKVDPVDGKVWPDARTVIDVASILPVLSAVPLTVTKSP